MVGINSPTSFGRVNLGIKITVEENETLQMLANQETNGNKSEMVRKLIQEALKSRDEIETMINEMANDEKEN